MSEPDPVVDDQYFVYFFVPLPEASGIPASAVFKFETPENVSDVLARTPIGAELDVGTENFCSLVAHSLEWTRPAHGIDAYLLAHLESVLPWLSDKKRDAPAPADGPLAGLTLIEAAVLVREVTDESISDAFDEALEAVRTLQRAYHMLTKLPTTLARREALPFVVMHAVARVAEGRPVEHSGLNPFLPHMHAHVAHEQLPFDAKFDSAMTIAAAIGPMHAYTEAMRDARVAHELRGEYKTAAIYYASAAESLLYNLLLHLMWEEGTSPLDAVDEYQSVRGGLRARVARLYQPRLKGGWKLDAGALKSWDNKTAELRHRAVHAGYEPSPDECRRSLDGLLELEDFVVKRLVSPAVLPRFPRTAMALLGEPGLRRRDRWTAAVARLAADADEPSWPASFGRWREVFELARRQAEGKAITRPDINRTELLVVRSGSELTWVRRDPLTRKAICVRPTNDADLAQVRRGLEEMEIPNPEVLDSVLVSPTYETEAVGDWMWDYELVPEAGFGLTR